MISELPGRDPPEVVIGVDFGMTQTGVAYCVAPWSNQPKTFQQWAGNVFEISNKVPSRLGYDFRTGKLKSWGFSVDLEDQNLDVQEHFKLYLDPDYTDDYGDLTNEDAHRYFRDFLGLVHAHVAKYFQNRIPSWNNIRVEWLFSVPTTWRHSGLVNEIESVIQSAGFGSDGPSHECRISLTEAEAAGISVASQFLEFGDTIMVCDAGGGTSDVNILKLLSPKGEPIRLDPLSKVEGKPIGSALIDIRVQQFLQNHLQQIKDQLSRDPALVAEQMMVGRFERFKVNFGNPGSDIPSLLLEVPGLPPGTNIPHANVVNSRIAVTSETLKKIFDEQVDALVAFIDQQVRALHDARPAERISYLVLSGGLGSSPYVQERLRSQFQEQSGPVCPAASGMRILCAEEPQLSVCHGLVLERSQQLAHALSPITSRLARVSYGIVVNKPYNPREHQGLTYTKDPRDGKKWLVDQIEWLIKEGEKLSAEGIEKRFKAKIDSFQLRQPWHAHFVMSMEQKPNLPMTLTHPSVRTLCIVEADIRGAKRVVKNAHWYNFAKRHELAVIDVKIIPGSADLKFEVWNDGRRLNGDHDQVEVKWEKQLRTPSSSPRSHHSGAWQTTSTFFEQPKHESWAR